MSSRVSKFLTPLLVSGTKAVPSIIRTPQEVGLEDNKFASESYEIVNSPPRPEVRRLEESDVSSSSESSVDTNSKKKKFRESAESAAGSSTSNGSKPLESESKVGSSTDVRKSASGSPSVLAQQGESYIAETVKEAIQVPGLNDISNNFGSAFTNSLGMIFATEIGDKTFFIAAIMAMRNPRLIVFCGAIGALSVMTVLSTILGHALPHLLPKMLTHYCSILLFVYFGIRMLQDAKHMYATGEGTGVSEEMEEVESELVEKGLAEKHPGSEAGVVGKGFTELREIPDPEFGLDVDNDGNDHGPTQIQPQGLIRKPSSKEVIFQAFMLTFLAEWGDRSQIATIALAAAQNPYAVTIGAILGHSICTGGAVIGGKLLASRITERQVALSGGILFFIFAFYSWYVGM